MREGGRERQGMGKERKRDGVGGGQEEGGRERVVENAEGTRERGIR